MMGKDPDELIWAHVYAYDENGVRTMDAGDEVSFEVDGPAAILGVGNGDACEYVPFAQPSGHRLFGGCATAVLRRTGAGPFTLKVTSPSLNHASLTLTPQEGK